MSTVLPDAAAGHGSEARGAAATQVGADAASREDFDVIVIGGGAAGIGAVRELRRLDLDAPRAASGRRPRSTKVILLEARDRLGGRAWTAQLPSSVSRAAPAAATGARSTVPTDLGAAWLHQASSSNALAQLARNSGVRVGAAPKDVRTPAVSSARPSGPVGWAAFDPASVEEAMANGARKDECCAAARVDDTERGAASGMLDAAMRTSRRLVSKAAREAAKHGRPACELDFSVEEGLAAQCPEVFGTAAVREHSRAARLVRFEADRLEHMEGGDFDEMSAAYWDCGGEMAGGDLVLPDGYGAFVASLGDGFDVRLNHEVVLVRRQSHAPSAVDPFPIEVQAVDNSDGRKASFRARCVIVTVPLGVLKADAIVFEPPLPEEKRAAIRRLGTAVMNKCILTFPRAFWSPSTAAICLVEPPMARPGPGAAGPVAQQHWPWLYNNEHTVGDAQLVAFLTGRRAQAVELEDDESIAAGIVRNLRLAYAPHAAPDSEEAARVVPDPVNATVTRWNSDRFARGSWTMFPPGTHGPEDFAAVAEPVCESAVMFAGEHTFIAAQGTVHGAFMSGQREGSRAHAFVAHRIAEDHARLCDEAPLRPLDPISSCPSAVDSRCSSPSSCGTPSGVVEQPELTFEQMTQAANAADLLRAGELPVPRLGLRITLKLPMGEEGETHRAAEVLRSDVARVALVSPPHAGDNGLSVENPAGLSRQCDVADLVDEIATRVEEGLRLAGMAGTVRGDHVIDGLAQCVAGDRRFALVVEDPLGLSLIAHDDAQVEEYERTWDEDDELGIHDIVSAAIDATTVTRGGAGGRATPSGPALGIARWRKSQAAELDDMQRFASLLSHAAHVCVLTGAGASAESGITPFRSWGDEVDDAKRAPGSTPFWKRYDPNLLTYQNFLSREDVREMFWDKDRAVYEQVSNAAPNPAHTFWAELADTGTQVDVITQNIDGLHERAGTAKERLTELHGSLLAPVTCVGCGASYDQRAVRRRVASGTQRVPICDGVDVTAPPPGGAAALRWSTSSTGCGKPLKPGTVLFGQPLDGASSRRARASLAGCDALVVVGSSLVVEPANTFPGLCLQRGCPVALVNLGATKYDDAVDVLIRAPAGETFAKLRRLMKLEGGAQESRVHPPYDERAEFAAPSPRAVAACDELSAAAALYVARCGGRR